MSKNSCKLVMCVMGFTRIEQALNVTNDRILCLDDMEVETDAAS